MQGLHGDVEYWRSNGKMNILHIVNILFELGFHMSQFYMLR